MTQMQTANATPTKFAGAAVHVCEAVVGLGHRLHERAVVLCKEMRETRLSAQAQLRNYDQDQQEAGAPAEAKLLSEEQRRPM